LKLREQDKHFLWSLAAAVGVIFVWKGLWEGLYEIPYFGDPWVALFVGLTMITLSGLIFKEFDPLGNLDKSAKKIVAQVKKHPQRKEFRVKYYDRISKKNLSVNADDIRDIERSSLIVRHKDNKEMFIPTHRIVEVTHKGKTYWRM